MFDLFCVRFVFCSICKNYVTCVLRLHPHTWHGNICFLMGFHMCACGFNGNTSALAWFQHETHDANMRSCPWCVSWRACLRTHSQIDSCDVHRFVSCCSQTCNPDLQIFRAPVAMAAKRPRGGMRRETIWPDIAVVHISDMLNAWMEKRMSRDLVGLLAEGSGVLQHVCGLGVIETCVV